jgi:hypothetical protein
MSVVTLLRPFTTTRVIRSTLASRLPTYSHTKLAPTSVIVLKHGRTMTTVTGPLTDAIKDDHEEVTTVSPGIILLHKF